MFHRISYSGYMDSYIWKEQYVDICIKNSQRFDNLATK